MAADDPEWQDGRKAAEDAAVAYRSDKRARGFPSLPGNVWRGYRRSDSQMAGISRPRCGGRGVAGSRTERKRQPSRRCAINMANWYSEPIPEQERASSIDFRPSLRTRSKIDHPNKASWKDHRGRYRKLYQRGFPGPEFATVRWCSGIAGLHASSRFAGVRAVCCGSPGSSYFMGMRRSLERKSVPKPPVASYGEVPSAELPALQMSDHEIRECTSIGRAVCGGFMERS